jgi:hypothetical protein
MLNKREISRLKASIETNKSSWNSTFWEVFAYTQPERNYIFRQKGFTTPENQKQIMLLTNAGRLGTDIFVARLQNRLVPYKQPYIQLVPKESLSDAQERETKDLAAELSAASNERKNELGLDDLLNQSFYDLCAGTACIMSQTTRHGLSFEKMPLDEISLGTERNQTVVRNFKIQMIKVGEIFPELAGRKQIGSQFMSESNMYDEIPLSDMLYYNALDQLWEYYLLEGESVILSRQYKYSPYHIIHWSRASDMPFGNGIGQKVLPNIKRLNKYIKSKLELIPFAFPMFLTQHGAIMDKNITYKPGGHIFCRDPKQVIPVHLSKDASNFQIEISTEEMQIKEAMLDLPLPTIPTKMTATEVQAREQSSSESFNANVMRLTDVLESIAWEIVEDVFNRELFGLVDFDFEYIRQSFDMKINNDSQIDQNLIQKIQGYIAFVGQFDPQAIYQSMPRSKTLAKLQKSFNLPSELRRTPQEIDEVADTAAQAEAQAAEAQINTQMAIDQNKAVAAQEAKKEA